MRIGALHEILAEIRDLYVENQLKIAIARRTAEATAPNASEVKFSNIDGLYKGLAAVDWSERPFRKGLSGRGMDDSKELRPSWR